MLHLPEEEKETAQMPLTKQVIKKTPMAPTALIAGGAGFLGSALAETLLLKDARVIVIDNFKTGKKSYVDKLLSNDKFALYDCDISKGLPPEIESVDYVFHLAAIDPHTYSSEKVDFDTLLTNAVGTKFLLELAHNSEGKFLLASSVNVYRGAISPLSLDQYFGQTPYEEKEYSINEAKRFAEALAWEFYKKYDADIRIARLPEIYGPFMNLDSCGNLGQMLKDMSTGKDLEIVGEGDEKEFYLYVSDAVSGLVKSLFNKNTSGKIYTLVGNEAATTLELAYTLKSIANTDLKLDFKSKPKTFGFFEFHNPDTDTLGGLKWEPKVPLKEGLINTLSSLGYVANEYAFKPAKLIEDKRKEKVSVNSISAPQSKTPVADTIVSLVNEQTEQPSTIVPDKGSFVVVKPIISEPPKSLANLLLKKLSNTLPTNSSARSLKVKYRFLGVLGVFVALLIMFTFVPAFGAYTNAKRGASELRQLPSLFSQLDASSKATSKSAFEHFSASRTYLSRVKWLFDVSAKKETYDSVNNLLLSAENVSKSIYNISKATNPFNAVWDTLKPTTTTELSQADFDAAKTSLQTAKNNLQLANAEFKNVNIVKLPLQVQSQAEEFGKALTIMTQGLDMAYTSVDSVPDLLGVSDKRRYLVLFQNSNELRPTGGFIGSYAILELNKGKIANLTIDDIYNPDGQIKLRKINVPSPAPIAQLLKEPNLSIHNANWNPDFPQSARDINSLFYKLNATKFDGVIAVNIGFVKDLLKVTGPVFLTAYSEEITSDNVDERAQFHSEFNYTEGSSQKKSFLTILGSKLLEKVFAMQKEQLPELFSQVQTALVVRDIMIYLPNNRLATLLADNNFDGAIRKTAGDFLYVVDANLGGTKANYYVTKDMSYTISSATRDGLLRGTVTLHYKHTGVDSSWPSGTLVDYLRVITQKGTKLTGATLLDENGKEQDIFKDIVIGKVADLPSYETSFKLDPTKEVTVKIMYDLPQSETLSFANKKYSLVWQKQSGTSDDKIRFEFDAPFGLTFDTYSQALQLDSGKLVLDSTLATDKDLYVGLK